MSQINRLTLKNKWVTGYEPTENDYKDFFDSFYNILDDEVSSGNLISDTYSNILTLVNTSGLTAGQMYLITDHVTKHIIPNTTVINSGNTEPLILLATSSTTFDKTVYSTIYPEDTIHFDFNSNLCEDNTTPRTGKIIYRKDKFNNSCYYDFRNVKFRRWSVDCSVIWSSGTTYTKNDLIKYNNVIYQVTNNTNSGDTTKPFIDSLHYCQFFDLYLTVYWAWTDNKNIFNIGNSPNKTNLILNSASTFIDCYTFDDGAGNIVNGDFNNNVIYNNEIKYCNSTYVDIYNGDYNNIVFIKANDIYNNIIGNDSFNNTTTNYFNNNNISANFYNNIIYQSFQYNIINNFFHNNTIAVNFSNNTIYNYFDNNTIDINFSYNTIGNYFSSNTIGNTFQLNSIDINFEGNVIGNNFSYNTIGNYFSSNTIGNTFQSNTIESNKFGLDLINNRYNNHIYLNYNTTISSNSVGSVKVEYIDYDSVLTIVDADGTEHKMGGSGGSGSTGLISDTYLNLSALVSTSSLIVGQMYLLTDHQTKHIIPNTSDINTGNLEPLILLATSINKFDNFAYSTVYPDDTIHFDFNSNLCEDNSTPRTGKITYRKDKFNNSTYYDFRNVKFRRWSVDCSVNWVSGTTYAKNDLVKYDTIIYIVTNNTNSGDTITPNIDSLHYCIYLNLTNTSYCLWTDNINDFNVGNNPNKTNLTIGSYIDCYTFDDGSGNIVNGSVNVTFIYNNEIKFCETINGNSTYNGDYNNIVFMYAYRIYDNIIEYNSMNNTIYNIFTGNIIGHGFYANVIGHDFNFNVIGHSFYANTVDIEFQYNSIENDFYSNTLAQSITYNIIEHDFAQNIIGHSFQYNTIKDSFFNNVIGHSFFNNNISNNFESNVINNYNMNYTITNNYVDIFKTMDIIYSYSNTYESILKSNYKLKANVTLTNGTDSAYFELNYNINNNTLLLISENFITTNNTLYNFNSISIALTNNNFIITDNSSTNITTTFNVTETKLL